tara:strand:+ start:462 stop:1661 length:1200 start_codon:yes stop_codon:yes gene_type:complete
VKKKNNLIPKENDKPEYVPDTISVKNMSIYDMEKIHSFVLKFFNNEYKRIPDITEKIEYENNILGSHQTYVERCQTLSKIQTLQKELDDIKTFKNKDSYMKEIKPLMKEFEYAFDNMDKDKFGEVENGSDNSQDKEEVTRIMLLIISTVKKYTNISFDVELTSICHCVECDFDLTNVIPEADGIIRCPECRVENEANRYPKKSISTSKHSSTHHGDYSERGNFIKFINRFQGKQDANVDDKIKAKLDSYFIKEKLEIGSIVKQRPNDIKGFKVGTSLNMMLKALKSCGFSAYYDDVYLICREYWGWELADFKNDEDEILYMYDITQMAYNKIENRTRSSSISIPFQAFKIIELLGYPYEVVDFKIPKDDKSKEETDKYWKISCQNCGDPKVQYIPTRKY